ncbi:MAG TPA: cytochrome D1 domain-containing protein [Longimicrobiaceae bacterium]|nr:cytochrome D1 domain-containing protein [Longimicrobiaceae bacterium]
MSQLPSRVRASALAGIVAAVHALAAPAAAQEHQHGQHPHADTAARPAATPTEGRPRVDVPNAAHVRAEFTYGPATADSAFPGAALERKELEIRVRLTDAATGRPLRGLRPMAYVDVRPAEGTTDIEVCRQKLGSFLESGMMIKHGQMNLAQPVEDLNSHWVVALAVTPQVVVLDPVKGFGRTRMYTTVPLRSPGHDWVSTPDDRRLFVTLPASGEVAVVNTASWKLDGSVQAGTRPTDVAMQPGGRFVWVSDDAGEQGGVTVIDAASLRVRETIRTGQGPHVVTFSDDGRWAFVANRGAGTLTLIDAQRLQRRGEIAVADPVDVAWSAPLSQAFVASGSEGVVHVVDPARMAIVNRIEFKPGISTFRFPPELQGGHAGHAGHGEGVSPAGRVAFVTNPKEGTVEIVDVVAGRFIRSLSGAPEPDQIGFSPGFAYVRAAGTANVAMIPLSDPTQGAIGPHDYFPGGSTVPGRVADGLGEVIVPVPGGHDAIYVANPSENMIYSFHYMEGMPVPHGGLTTYTFQPRSIRTVSRAVREVEPGVYTATFTLDRPGNYDLIFRSPDPVFLGCWGFDVRVDPRLRPSSAYQIAAVVAERRLAVGRNTLRFRVTDTRQHAPLAEVPDLRVQFASPGGVQRRVDAKPVGEGLYEVEVEVPEAGVYYVSFEAASLGIGYRDRSPLIYSAQ